ncbi:hypothetical protein A0H81_07954 [Grifola frondosa]|uniref:Uncharacterized protein n=1 Tax=Grifola frondosa TaxID=5627 RepID=A0A1C7M6I2_GRIFR|nr:hypothetical protein A0H81_07954 [Grifola frondosa]
MATPIIVGVGAIAAAIAGRQLLRRGILGGKGAAEQWVKGGFKAKMDRKEAIAILGLKDGPLLKKNLRMPTGRSCWLITLTEEDDIGLHLPIPHVFVFYTVSFIIPVHCCNNTRLSSSILDFCISTCFLQVVVGPSLLMGC